MFRIFFFFVNIVRLCYCCLKSLMIVGSETKCFQELTVRLFLKGYSQDEFRPS